MRASSVRVFMPAFHALHQPERDFSDGIPGIPHPEVPGRVDRVLEGLSSVWQVETQGVRGMALERVRALHDADYVSYLVDFSNDLSAGSQYVPTLFRPDLSRAPLARRGGMYCEELGTPIGAHTVNSALNAAAAAEEAAAAVVAESLDTVALVRPPGHHAGLRRYGGYCYFNNAYLAASVLSEHGRCGVLDIDYHLGDGSAEFASEQIPYFSLHADPWRCYPHLDAHWTPGSRHAVLETLPVGVDGEGYLEVLNSLVERIDALSLDYLVLSLGFDTLSGDAVQDEPVNVQAEDFEAVGHLLSWLRPRMVVLLEGGYDLDRLAACAAAFATGFSR